MTTQMNWYLVKLVYQVISGNGLHTPQFDEQLRLIRADEPEWAREKAKVMGQIGAFTFMNQREEEVNWKFIDVTDVRELESLEDGIEIYSTTEEPLDVNSYLELVNAKARLTADQKYEKIVA